MLEQFAIGRLLREEVDDKRGDVSSKEHQHQYSRASNKKAAKSPSQY